MKLISLNQNKETIIDNCDEHLALYKWFCRKDGKNYYAYASYRIKDGTSRHIQLHHAIIGFPLNKFEVDHINGDGLDNRRSNLRIVSHRENMSNRRERRLGKTTSNFVGVSWNKNSRKWVANIYLPKKGMKYLGMFNSEIDAKNAYVKILNKLKEAKCKSYE